MNTEETKNKYALQFNFHDFEMFLRGQPLHVIDDAVTELMDALAKQEALQFNEFTTKNGWKYVYVMGHFISRIGEVKSENELFEIYQSREEEG